MGKNLAHNGTHIAKFPQISQNGRGPQDAAMRQKSHAHAAQSHHTQYWKNTVA
jgi:hypothetical protein